jgi:hypothetical protein
MINYQVKGKNEMAWGISQWSSGDNLIWETKGPFHYLWGIDIYRETRRRNWIYLPGVCSQLEDQAEEI